MKKKSDKKNDIESLRKDLAGTGNVFITGYSKLNVSQDFELRKAVRSAGGKYRVVKNTLAGKAAEGTPSEAAMKDQSGMTSLAYTTGDPVALAKVLTAYAKTNPSFTFKAGVVEGRVIEVSSIAELASLPSKEAIFAKLLGVINAPAQRLAGAINAVGSKLAATIDQGVKESKFQES